MGSASIISPAGGSGLGSVPTVKTYSEFTDYSAGDSVLYSGIEVIANATIPAGTPFSWGAYGSATATWRPSQFGTAFKGIYSGATAYLVGNVAVSDATGTAIYTSIQNSTGIALNNSAYWHPSSVTITSNVQEVLAYSIGNTYYADQRVLVGGVVLIPNGTIPAGTAITLGTTGATWRVDTNNNKLYSSSEVFTGHYFIDNKPIYRRVYSVPDASGNDQIATINLGFTVTSYFAIVGGFAPIASGAYLILPGGSASGTGAASVSSYLSGAKNALLIDGSTSTDINAGGYVVVEYTR